MFENVAVFFFFSLTSGLSSSGPGRGELSAPNGKTNVCVLCAVISPPPLRLAAPLPPRRPQFDVTAVFRHAFAPVDTEATRAGKV